MKNVPMDFSERFEALPGLVQERLVRIARSVLDENVTAVEHQRLLADWAGDRFPGTEAQRAEYGWILERMSTETICEWVIGHGQGGVK